MHLQLDFARQLDVILKTFDSLRAQARHDDLSGGAGDDEIVRFNTRALAAIERIAGFGSAYMGECQRILDSGLWVGSRAIQLAGVARSLLDDVNDGYITSARELIHAELFGDFLEMAAHLLEEGYKDAAAVVSGSSLEAHLKQLAAKHNVPVEHATANGSRPKKADTLNGELSNAGAYSKLDQKNVTAWLDLRNKAAHGNYSDYDRSQVTLHIAGIRDFITRIPA